MTPDPTPDSTTHDPIRYCQCGKRAFLTTGEAQRLRRHWQRRSRKAHFNDLHIYRCDEDPRYLHLGGRHDG
jgi:hypothetical protein